MYQLHGCLTVAWYRQALLQADLLRARTKDELMLRFITSRPSVRLGFVSMALKQLCACSLCELLRNALLHCPVGAVAGRGMFESLIRQFRDDLGLNDPTPTKGIDLKAEIAAMDSEIKRLKTEPITPGEWRPLVVGTA